MLEQKRPYSGCPGVSACNTVLASSRHVLDKAPDTAKLTKVIATGFGESCNLITESKMFVKDEAKVTSRVGGVK